MIEYISKRSAIETIRGCGIFKSKFLFDSEPFISLEEAEYELMSLESENVQPVVKCKDCKHYKTTGNFKTYCDEENFSDEGQKELPEWWFCAGGKRKGDENDQI